MTRYELIGFILAFAGLAVALDPTFRQLDPVGLALAFSGSIGSVLFILSYEKFPRGTDSYVGSMWITLGTIILCIISLQFGFELTPPRENAGWFYMVAIVGCSVIAFVLSLRTIKKVGAAVFALFLNFEPVVILLLAWIVIGEDLTLARISDIVMVVMALIISHWRKPAGSQ